MKKISFLFCFLAWSASVWASSFQPFYVQSTGSNLNSGSTADDTANTTYTSKVVASGWDSTTGIFTVASGNPSTDAGVTNGAFASIYVTSGATTNTFTARITGTTTTTFTVSLTACSGTPPATDATGATTAKIGGAWAGPTMSVMFPFGYPSGSMTNSSGQGPLIYIKGTYFTTNNLIEAGNNGPVWWKGYTNTLGDDGFVNIYGSNTIAGYNLLKVTGQNRCFMQFNVATNGNSGGASQHAIFCSGGENLFYRCVAHDAWLAGIGISGVNSLVSCEAWNCNLANNGSYGGIYSSAAGNMLINCFSHHNTNALSSGYRIDIAQVMIGCIAATNGGDGFQINGDVQEGLIGCASWGNGGNGVNYVGASGTISDSANMLVINCSILGNTLTGITNTGASSSGAYYNGVFLNNGFGSGSAANGKGDIETRIKGIMESNTVTYASGQTPWTAPYTGNFSITSATAGAKGAGYGTYLGTYPGNALTIAYPDIGPAQSTSTNTPGGATSYGSSQ